MYHNTGIHSKEAISDMAFMSERRASSLTAAWLCIAQCLWGVPRHPRPATPRGGLEQSGSRPLNLRGGL